MTCPHCNGEGFQYGMFPCYADDVPQEQRKPIVRINCTLCDGVGTIDDGFPAREAYGQTIRAARLKYDLSLREFAKRFDIDVVRLSALERGKKMDEEINAKCKSALLELEQSESTS